MDDGPGMRGRAIGLAAAAVVGAAAGFLCGWLAFGRAGPAREAGTLVDIRGLAESVDRLGAAVEHLAKAKHDAAAREAVPERPVAKPAPPPIEPGVKFHSTFEKGTDGWFVARFAPEIIGEVAHTTEAGHAKEGTGALALRYTLEPGKVPAVVRMATSINRLSFWVRTLERPAELVVAASEKDESSYQTMLHLEPAEGWKRLDLDLTTFTLSDDSTDENERLDIREIRSVAVLDVAAFMGGLGPNTILIDDVIGEYRAAPAGGGPRKDERF